MTYNSFSPYPFRSHDMRAIQRDESQAAMVTNTTLNIQFHFAFDVQLRQIFLFFRAQTLKCLEIYFKQCINNYNCNYDNFNDCGA